MGEVTCTENANFSTNKTLGQPVLYPLSIRDVLVIKCTAFYIAATRRPRNKVAKKVANVNDGRV